MDPGFLARVDQRPVGPASLTRSPSEFNESHSSELECLSWSSGERDPRKIDSTAV